MAYKFVDRAQMSMSGAPGTGPISLATALNGYQSIYGPNGLSNGDTFRYLAVDPSGAWEIGIGTYSSTGNVVTRSPTRSSAAGNALVTLSSNASIGCTFAAEDISTGSLAGLADVNVTEGAGIDTYSLTWDNGTGKWIASPGGATSTLAGLSDVDVTSPTNNQALLYESGASKWENVSLASVALSGAYSALTGAPTIPVNATFDLSGLGDVTITSVADDDVVTWNSGAGKWENKPPSGGGGGSGTVTTVANNGTNVDTAAVTLNFVNATSITTSSHDVTITLPTGGGGGGSAPTIVQSAAFVQEGQPYTMGSAPVEGNLLIACVSHWSSGDTVGAGWNALVNISGSNDYTAIMYRVCDGTDTTSLAPVNSVAGTGVTIYELSGAAYVIPLLWMVYHDVSSATQTLSVFAPNNALVLGQFTSTSNDGLPTGITGATAGPTASAASGGGSGYGRSAAAFHASGAGAAVTVVATYGGSQDCNGQIIVIQGVGTV